MALWNDIIVPNRVRLAGLEDGAEDMEVWSPQDIMSLRVDAIADTPSFCFLWSGSGVSLQWGRACLRKWGYRRCEDICWIKSNREVRARATEHAAGKPRRHCPAFPADALSPGARHLARPARARRSASMAVDAIFIGFQTP